MCLFIFGKKMQNIYFIKNLGAEFTLAGFLKRQNSVKLKKINYDIFHELKK